MLDGRLAPSPNEEVLLYQSMLGIWPLEALRSEEERSQLRERIETFMLKAAREAKTHSSWVSPNEAHESALRELHRGRLRLLRAENPFLRDFCEFGERIAPYGACNALAQVLLKITSPGVPDFFQGNELWNFRLTDPDNRVDVDFEKRRKVSETLDASAAPSKLLENWRDGRLKMLLTRGALRFRRANRDLFQKGDYLALEAEGERRESVCAYARRLGNSWAFDCGAAFGDEARHGPRIPSRGIGVGPSAVVLSTGAPARWKNIFTGAAVSGSGARKKRLPLGDIFSELPFAFWRPRFSDCFPPQSTDRFPQWYNRRSSQLIIERIARGGFGLPCEIGAAGERAREVMESEREKRLKSARRLVIKVGTSTVTGADGEVCAERVGPIVQSIAKLMQEGRQVVLVSSGAVGLGRGWLGLHPFAPERHGDHAGVRCRGAESADGRVSRSVFHVEDQNRAGAAH